MNTKTLGDLGEKIALNYLKDKGYQVLDKNYSSKIVSGPQKGEIDIVAKRKDVISFVEVKTLKDSTPFLPERKVNYLKQRKIIKTAKSWLMRNKIPLNSKWQIDVISLQVNLDNKQAKIRHFKNAVF